MADGVSQCSRPDRGESIGPAAGCQAAGAILLSYEPPATQGDIAVFGSHGSAAGLLWGCQRYLQPCLEASGRLNLRQMCLFEKLW